MVLGQTIIIPNFSFCPPNQKQAIKVTIPTFPTQVLIQEATFLDGRKFGPSGTGLFMVNKDQDQSFMKDFNKYFH